MRWVICSLVKFIQFFFNLPTDFESVVKIGEQMFFLIFRLKLNRAIPQVKSQTSISLGNVRFSSPITFAAFQGDYRQMMLWLQLGLGGGCMKTIMKSPRPGNFRPRYQQVNIEGKPLLVNALGLPGVGIDAFLKHKMLPRLMAFNRPLGISIGGHCDDDYRIVFDKAVQFLRSNTSYQFYCELNVSCPNTPSGTDLSQNPNQLKSLLLYMRSISNCLIGVKLSPMQSNEELVSISKLVGAISNTYINLGNTQFKSCAEIGLGANHLSIGGGGVSGPILYSRTREMVGLISKERIPIIATGGISNSNQASDILNHGATLVGVATALVTDPFDVSSWSRNL
jgi:dihydroorotate dehydrogenase